MPDFVVSFRSRQRGPFKTGAIRRQAHNYEEDVAKEVAEEGKRVVLRHLHQVLRHPTGYYESRIDTRPLPGNRYEIHDSGVIYGPWLEGTGSRNSPVTRFPGYHTFQLSEEETNRRKRNIARRILREYRSRGMLR